MLQYICGKNISHIGGFKNNMKKRILTIGLAIIMVFAVLAFGGCSEYSGREIEVDGWTLFRFTQSRKVNIISANCESLVVDGVLYIPSRIGGHDIHGFGRWSHAPWPGMEHFFTMTKRGENGWPVQALEVRKIVLAKELSVGRLFWSGRGAWAGAVENVRYIEFLCNTFERIDFIGQSEERRFIILPDGSTQNFRDRFGNNPTVIEKSYWLANQN